MLERSDAINADLAAKAEARRQQEQQIRAWKKANPPNTYKYISGKAEHRLVMERHIGRKLEAHENVHHINGVRHDNRIENLELWSTSQPAGQRIEDKVAWAKKLLALYEPSALVDGDAAAA